MQGDLGQLECLSLGDYGKDVNLKADFLGLNRKIGKVSHKQMLPLSEKWVITISTQYGCSMGCKFCDVPKVGTGKNATYRDLFQQIYTAISLHPEVKHTNRLNIHFARMGEPTWNSDVLTITGLMHGALNWRLGDSPIHPVVSTMMPYNNVNLLSFLKEWMYIKNEIYKGNAGLQFSINSTSDEERKIMFNNNANPLEDVAGIGDRLPTPKGRKITLNFAVANYEVDANKLRKLFDPQKFVVKLTPTHKTRTAIENNIKTQGDYTTIYPYEKIESQLKEAGFDVLVFIASEYEDLSRITCGNAILSGSMPECP